MMRFGLLGGMFAGGCALVACQAISGLGGFGLQPGAGGGVSSANGGPSAGGATTTGSSQGGTAQVGPGVTGPTTSVTGPTTDVTGTTTTGTTTTGTTVTSGGIGGSSGTGSVVDCAHFVFLSEAFIYPQTSLAEADVKCANEAAKGPFPLKVKWLAVLSTVAAPAGSRIIPSGDVCMYDGNNYATVATKNFWWSTTHQSPIDHRANGVYDNFPEIVWTGTNPDGSTNGENCKDFSSNDGADKGRMGSSFAANGDWVSTGSFFCNGLHPIYCFSMPMAVK